MTHKWYKKISTWLIILFCLIMTPLIIIFGTIFVKSQMYKDKIPDFMGYKPMIVLSGSMENKISVGDLATVKMTNPDTLKLKDVIAFRNSDGTVTLHRIIEILEENGTKKFKTKGDVNNINDTETVSVDDVEGIYINKIVALGHVLMFLQKPIGLFTVCFGIIIIGVSITLLYDRKTKVKISKEELKDFEEFKKLKNNKLNKDDKKDKSKPN